MDASAITLGDEDVMVGRNANDARALEPGGEQLRLKAGKRLGRGIRGTRDDLRTRSGRITRKGGGQIGRGNFSPNARGVATPIRKCGCALQQGKRLRHRHVGDKNGSKRREQNFNTAAPVVDGCSPSPEGCCFRAERYE